MKSILCIYEHVFRKIILTDFHALLVRFYAIITGTSNPPPVSDLRIFTKLRIFAVPVFRNFIVPVFLLSQLLLIIRSVNKYKVYKLSGKNFKTFECSPPSH